jgi:type IV secretion system protein VirB9
MKRFLLALLFAPAMAVAQPVETGVDPAIAVRVNSSGSYKVSGSVLIRPSLIWDDGQKTYLEWPENIEAPAIFAIDAAGQESLVNCYYRDGKFVIDAVYSRLLFRIDHLVAKADRKVGRS